MAELIQAMVPFVSMTMGISFFLGVSSMLIGYLMGAVTGRNEGRRFF